MEPQRSWPTRSAAQLLFIMSPCLLATSWSSTARAFTIETAVTRGCHEQVTAAAFRAARAAFPETTGALPLQGDDRALIDDVPFTVPGDMDDIGAVTLLLGVRDNDVKDIAATQLDQFAALTASEDGQREHCLRTADQAEPSGTRDALDDCRQYIRETLLSALDGLDARGRPDGKKRDRLTVTLALRGRIAVDVPTFYLRAGRGLHALEDSFTHALRLEDDARQVTAVLNWVDYASNRLEPSNDGPAHSSELDRCDDPDALRTERRELATAAATEALQALLDPSLDRAGKTRALDAVLDRYLMHAEDAGCNAGNDWCDAHELAYEAAACGCVVLGSSAAQSRRAPFMLGVTMTATLLLLARSRRRRKRVHTAPPLAAVHRPAHWPSLMLAICIGASLLSPARARADEPVAAGTQGGPLSALDGDSNAGAPGATDAAGAWFGRVAIGASFDKPGFSGGLGIRYQLDDAWMFGFDAEWNPWLTITPSALHAGAINTYASVIRRFQLESDSLNVRTSVSLGTSVLLTNLVGAPSGSVGPYVGLSFLGVEWKATPGFYLTIEPAYIAFPIPHITGVPFGYLQYRFQVGLELGG